MKPWTLTLFSFFLCSSSLACHFKKNIKSVYSLSGPITTTLKEWDLLKHPLVKGVSIFHPVSQKDFSGKFIPGGIFLSPKLIQEMKGGVVFYDESRELTEVLSENKIEAIEIKTRGLLPLEVTLLVTEILRSKTESCEKEEQGLMASTKNLELSLKAKIKSKPWFIFFLGSYVREKLPEMVMVQDGMVKWLLKENLIRSYPSNLPYVSWSAKVLNGLPKETKYILLKDSGNLLDKKVIKNSNQVVSLIYPGALIPGIDQLRALDYLFSEIN